MPVELEKDEQPYFSVYPNPANRSKYLYITTSDVGNMKFSLFNSEGKLKTQLIQSTEKPVALEPLNLADGMYYYSIQTANYFYKGKVVITD